MAVTRVTRSIAAQQRTPTAVWSRPTDWLPLPTLNVGDQKVVGLVAVGQGGGNVAFQCAGAYTVDWGDGTAPVNYATGVKAERNIAWANVPASTLTREGFRQAIVTITPQAGQSLTQVRFDANPTGYGNGYVSPWRDIAVVGAAVNDCRLSFDTQRNGTRWFTYVGPSSIVTLVDFARAAPQLRGITGTQWTANATTMQRMLLGCNNLLSVPAFDCSALTSVQAMFQNCFALRTGPALDTSRCSDFSAMFQSCTLLTNVPLYDTSLGTTFNSMFSGCTSLQSLPTLNTSKGTDFTSMFNGCTLLLTVPPFDTGLGITFASMFAGCKSITTIPLLNTSKGANFSSMFTQCTALQTLPAIDVGLGTNFANMFDTCSSLTTLPVLNTSKGTAFGNFVWSCGALQGIDIDLSAAPNSASMNQMVGGASALASIAFRGLRFSPQAANPSGMGLTAAALNALYTSLGTASGAQTLTVTNNPGSGASTPSIATAKGWTVVGG